MKEARLEGRFRKEVTQAERKFPEGQVATAGLVQRGQSR
jgi:hypothetical protein